MEIKAKQKWKGKERKGKERRGKKRHAGKFSMANCLAGDVPLDNCYVFDLPKSGKEKAATATTTITTSTARTTGIRRCRHAHLDRVLSSTPSQRGNDIYVTCFINKHQAKLHEIANCRC